MGCGNVAFVCFGLEGGSWVKSTGTHMKVQLSVGGSPNGSWRFGAPPSTTNTSPGRAGCTAAPARACRQYTDRRLNTARGRSVSSIRLLKKLAHGRPQCGRV